MNKTEILAALSAFAEQRPGIEPGNYATWRDYRNESASVTADLQDARRLIRYVELRDSITADHLIKALGNSRRLTLKVGGTLDYTTGQYFPVEYRKAVCAALASVIWNWLRDSCGYETRDDMTDAIEREFGNCRINRRYFN